MNKKNEDKELIRRVSTGDEKAFEKLFSRYFHYLHNVAYNRLRSKEAADDIVQDIFANLWKNRKTLVVHTSVTSYLYQAVKNQAYKFIQYQSVRDKEIYIQRIYHEYYAHSPFPQSHQMIERDELKRSVSKYLDDLPIKSRNIFHLSREEHYTHKEIAEKLNCSPKTVEYHIGKTLQYLRIHLKDYVAILIPFSLLLLW